LQLLNVIKTENDKWLKLNITKYNIILYYIEYH